MTGSASVLGVFVLLAELATLVSAARHNQKDATAVDVAVQDVSTAEVRKDGSEAEQQRAEASKAEGARGHEAAEAPNDPMGRVAFSLPAFPPKPQRPPANSGSSIPAPSSLHKLPKPWHPPLPFIKHNGAYGVAPHGVAGSAEAVEATPSVSPKPFQGDKLRPKWLRPWSVLRLPWKQNLPTTADDEASLKARLFELNLKFLEFRITLPSEVSAGDDPKTQMPTVVIVDALKHFAVAVKKLEDAKAFLNQDTIVLQSASLRAGLALEQLHGTPTFYFDGSSPDALTQLERARTDFEIQQAEVDRKAGLVSAAEKRLEVAEEDAEARFAESSIWLRANSELIPTSEELFSTYGAEVPEYLASGAQAQINVADSAVKWMAEAKEMLSKAKVAFLEKTESLAALEALYDEKEIRESSKNVMVKTAWLRSGESSVFHAKADVEQSARLVQEATMRVRESVDKAELELARANIVISPF